VVVVSAALAAVTASGVVMLGTLSWAVRELSVLIVLGVRGRPTAPGSANDVSNR
jgi:hypothetical protein